MTCVTVPWLRAGTTLLLGERSCSWNVWESKTVIMGCRETALGRGTFGAYLWNCSLKNKVCHLGLCGVGSMDGDDRDVGIGIRSLKGEVYF